MIFTDTSAIYALADQADKNHAQAKHIANALNGQEVLIHNYIIVESVALIQHRLGFVQAKKFLEEVSQFRIVWIDAHLHQDAMNYFIKVGRRKVSFVDCVSFTLMRQEDIKKAFAFDQDFTNAGFELVSYHA